MGNAQTRTRRDPAIWERMVNAKFGGEQPILSGPESIAAAKKLYRHAMGKSWPGEWKLVSGRRYTWPRRGVFYVNPDHRGTQRGLRQIIHLISHYCHHRLHPHDKPHSIRQARLEAKLVDFAIARECWLDGKLKKPKPEAKPKPDLVQQRFARIVRRRDKYRAVMERTKKLLAKAEREVKAYERRHGNRLKAEAS
jgi:hypothetical protein